MHARQVTIALLERGKKAAVWLTGDPEDGEAVKTVEEALAAIDAMCAAAEDMNNKIKRTPAAPAVLPPAPADIGVLQALADNFKRYFEHATEKADKGSLRGVTIEGEWNRGRAVAYNRCHVEVVTVIKAARS